MVLSGQIGLHPPTMQLVSAEPEAQCICALRNLAAVLAVMGSQPAFVMAIAIFVTDEACTPLHAAGCIDKDRLASGSTNCTGVAGW